MSLQKRVNKVHYHVGNPRWEPKDLGYTILLHQYTTTLMNNESFTIDTEWKKHFLQQINFGELKSFRSKRLAICRGDDIFRNGLGDVVVICSFQRGEIRARVYI